MAPGMAHTSPHTTSRAAPGRREVPATVVAVPRMLEASLISRPWLVPAGGCPVLVFLVLLKGVVLRLLSPSPLPLWPLSLLLIPCCCHPASSSSSPFGFIRLSIFDRIRGTSINLPRFNTIRLPTRRRRLSPRSRSRPTTRPGNIKKQSTIYTIAQKKRGMYRQESLCCFIFTNSALVSSTPSPRTFMPSYSAFEPRVVQLPKSNAMVLHRFDRDDCQFAHGTWAQAKDG